MMIRPDDSIHADDKTSVINLDTQNIPEFKEGQEVELETEHGQTFYKVESEMMMMTKSQSSASQPSNTSALSVEEASKIATNEVKRKDY